ncbi:DUF4158 domain-containing protein [Streptosporangium sp. NPDC023963]|uniref:DUF4158 domain-containing protein n=1 Tax=Streptosporangium sp. NPDC023963 TaxID=3155608 RepID=UPI00342006DE
MPTEVLDCLAEQLGISGASCVKTYAQRESTRLEHAGQIQMAHRLREFADGEAELVSVLAAHAWNSGDGPIALFQWAVRVRRGDLHQRRLVRQGDLHQPRPVRRGDRVEAGAAGRSAGGAGG